MGALNMKPSTLDDMADPEEPDADDAEPNELELTAAEEFQTAAKGGTPAELVRAFRGLMAACEADYGEED